MAENLIKPAGAEEHAHRPWAWYPNVNKHSDSTFIYLESLKDNNYSKGIYTKAKNLMNSAFDSISAPDLTGLKMLIEREREKEDRFLNEKLKTTSKSPRDDANRILAFNRLY